MTKEEEAAAAQSTSEAAAAQSTSEAAAAEEAAVKAAEETVAAEAKAAEEAAAAKEKESVTPDKYELALPKDSHLDASVIDEIATYAKEQGLSNEAAQALVERESKAVDRFQTAQLESVEAAREQWAKDTASDKEIGGDDHKKNAELAVRVVERFGTPEFKKTLEETGFGDHPEVVRLFVRIGKAMADDELIHPKSKTPASERSAEEVLYGDEEKKD